jgi:hypothetical protein
MSKDDMNTILNDAVNTALYFLEKNGEFFPFGVVLVSNKEVRHVQGWTGDEQPPSEEVISLLKSGMRQAARRGEYLSIALVSDVRIRRANSEQIVDAIRISLEDMEAAPVICYLPYSLSDGSLLTEEMEFEPGESSIFNSAGS